MGIANSKEVGSDRSEDNDDDYDDDDAEEEDGEDDSDCLEVLLAGRVIVGAAIGIASAVVPVYISEVSLYFHCSYFRGLSIFPLFIFQGLCNFYNVYISEI